MPVLNFLKKHYLFLLLWLACTALFTTLRYGVISGWFSSWTVKEPASYLGNGWPVLDIITLATLSALVALGAQALHSRVEVSWLRDTLSFGAFATGMLGAIGGITVGYAGVPLAIFVTLIGYVVVLAAIGTVIGLVVGASALVMLAVDGIQKRYNK